MRAGWVVVTALALAGCGNAVKDAERELDIVRARGDQSEICKAARRVADAYLKEQRAKEYRQMAAIADAECLKAQTSEPPISADNMDVGAQ